MAFVALSLCSRAADISLDGICYKILEDGKLRVVPSNGSGNEGSSIAIGTDNGYSGEITIPATVEWEGINYIVTELAPYLFLGDNQITGINLPSTITNLGPTPFACCTKLEHITVDNGNATFCDLDGVLYNAAMDTLIACPGMKAGVFTVPSSVKVIDNSAFYGCTKLTSVSLPQYVTDIGAFAFRDCSSMKSVNLPQGLTELKMGVFYGCRLLNGVEIPSTVTTLGNQAFYYCQSLSSIILPDILIKIGDNAFEDCLKLSSITLPETLDTIGHRAFAGCMRLNTMTIPASVRSVGAAAFANCTALPWINVDQGNENYIEADGVLLTKDGTLLHTCPAGKQGEYTIPQGVTTIGESAFNSCMSLTKIQFPMSVQTIGQSALNSCFSLTEIKLPKNVRNIGDYAFYNCSSITRVTAYPTAVPAISTNTFPSYLFSRPLYVPVRHMSKYKKNSTWKKFTTILPIEEKVIATIEDTYAGAASMMHISIVSAETTVGTIGFDIVLPEGLSPVTDFEGNYIYTLGDMMPEGSTIAIENLGDNAWHMSISTGGKGLASNETPLVNLLVEADSSMPTGEYVGTIDEPTGILTDNYNVGMEYSEFPIVVGSALLGDVNLDGTVSLLDISLTINEVLEDNGNNFFCWQLGDINHDGSISLVDIVMIVDIILNQ